MLIREKITLKRQQAGLSMSELARRCELPIATVWNIEHGTRQPGLRTIARIASVLGICIDWLVREEDLLFPPSVKESCLKFAALSAESRAEVAEHIARLADKERKGRRPKHEPGHRP